VCADPFADDEAEQVVPEVVTVIDPSSCPIEPVTEAQAHSQPLVN
jgi:hypothetical protein